MADRTATTAALVWLAKDHRKTKGVATGLFKLDGSDTRLSGEWQAGKGIRLEGGEVLLDLHPHSNPKNGDERLRGTIRVGSEETKCSVFLSADQGTYIVRPWDQGGGRNDVTPF